MLILLWGCALPAEPSCQAFDFSGGRRIAWCNRRKPVAQRNRTGSLFALRCFGASAFIRVPSTGSDFFRGSHLRPQEICLRGSVSSRGAVPVFAADAAEESSSSSVACDMLGGLTRWSARPPEFSSVEGTRPRAGMTKKRRTYQPRIVNSVTCRARNRMGGPCDRYYRR